MRRSLIVFLSVFASSCRCWILRESRTKSLSIHDGAHWQLVRSTSTRRSRLLSGLGREHWVDQPSFSQVFPMNSALIHAASNVTQESCGLLGVKSIGVDYGLARTGVAVTVGYEPKPLAILTETNTTELSKDIIRYCIAEQVSRVVVGLPLHKNGTFAEQTNVTLQFSQILAREILRELGPGVPVLLWDERYTSKEAAARAHSQNPDRYLYGTLDAEAACIILEYYYRDDGVGAVAVQIEDEAVRVDCLKWYSRNREQDDLRKQNIAAERERKIFQRKEAIAKAVAEDRLREEEGGSKPKRKKRKRKR